MNVSAFVDLTVSDSKARAFAELVGEPEKLREAAAADLENMRAVILVYENTAYTRDYELAVEARQILGLEPAAPRPELDAPINLP